MKWLTASCLLLALAALLTDCKGNKQSDLSLLKGNILVDFAGKESHYQWKFNRSVNNRLELLQQTSFPGGKLAGLQLNDHQLAGLDYKNSRLIFFDSSLKHIGFFGPNPGDSLKGIMHFECMQDTLFLYDFGSRSVKKYHLGDNRLLYSRKIPDPAGVYRVCHLSGDRYIYAQPRDSIRDMAFILFDAAADSIMATYSLNQLLNITQKEDYPGMAYDGNFITDNNSPYIVYYCSFAGIFFCFDKATGTFAYTARTVDRTPAPKAAYVPITPKHKSLEISPNITFFPSACIQGGKLYLLNTINEPRDYVTDIYDLKSKGAYLESFYVPLSAAKATPAALVPDGKLLYVLYRDQSIVKYAINPF